MLRAAAAAREAAARASSSDTAPLTSKVRGRWTGWPTSAGITLERVTAQRSRRFRPTRRTNGPLPYATTYSHGASPGRTPWLTVPPIAFAGPEIRAELTAEPSAPKRGERFQRFQAQVEKTSPAEAVPGQANLPVPAGLPLASPPPLWRRLFSLFGAG